MDGTRQRILPSAAHTRADREVAYRAMHFAAGLLVRAGASVILDAPYGHAEDRDELARIGAGADLRIFECRVSPETAARRLRDRSPDPTRPDLTEEVVRRMVREYEYGGLQGSVLLDTGAQSAAGCLAIVEGVLSCRERDFPDSLPS